MPFLFYTYLAAEIINPFFASLAILTGILFIGNLHQLLETIISFQVPPAELLQIAAYAMPKLLLFSIPMASMMGVILGLTRMADDGEIMALKSYGIGLSQIIRPVILIALCTMTITGLCSLVLIPRYNSAIDMILANLARENLSNALHPKRFSNDFGNIVFYTEAVSQDNTWQGVYVIDNNDPKLPVIITADSAHLKNYNNQNVVSITLYNGSIRRANYLINQAMEFEQFTINIPISLDGNGKNFKKPKNSLSQEQLLARAKESGPHTNEGISLIHEYHKRLVLPVSAFILSILGIPLGLQAAPFKRSFGVPLGLTAFILYYICLTAAEALGNNSIIPIATAMWLPNILFGILTIIMLKRSNDNV